MCKSNQRTIASLMTISLLVISNTLAAATYHLCAQQGTVAMPDTTPITMWGFVEDDNANLLDGCGAGTISVPGPALTLPVGDTTLIVNVLNELPLVGGEEISLVIPGLKTTMMPVMFAADALGRTRVKSFTHEVAIGATGVYTWTGVTPGTHMYHSGTHPAVQVQMGLYGSVSSNVAALEAYPGKTYAQEVAVFYSEVDPALHAAVAGGTYGQPGFTSTIRYNPKYFLINGADSAVLSSGAPGTTTLLRLMNMGLTTHVPVLNGADFEVIAEDGYAYTHTQRQTSVMVGAGQTKDILVVNPAVAGDYTMFDRMLNLTNRTPAAISTLAAATGLSYNQTSPGSLITKLEVGTDGDTDGVIDRRDNCRDVVNVAQIDADQDGYGNRCDGDLNNDGMVNAGDIAAFRTAFQSSTFIAVADFSTDGAVNAGDISYFRRMLFNPPGP